MCLSGWHVAVAFLLSLAKIPATALHQCKTGGGHLLEDA
ncbi:hypothetical protein BN1012_Phect2677 [Candidatus Phaeomarinobacter ectocarpi]|uniref:Uncharacterized protein n=1 Tax=Candidatus Phaeomarinibacter ectocarpi TaxID=1458461 RepID=X5MN12_9HYPH|nr:hypothetical protein BN1012_Phect2677 [Candidatus Phaeomarinobacter ectocarpi]